MKEGKQRLILFACLVGLTFGRIVDNDDDGYQRYDGVIRIEPGLSDTEQAELSSIIGGRTKALHAQSLLESGLLAADLSDEVENLCPNHTELIIQAVAAGELWAVQMIDAIGRQPSALLYDGNLRWLGSWEECIAVEPVAYTDPINKTDPYTPFTPVYCQTKFTFNQPLVFKKQVTVGMCLPSTCTVQELKTLSNTLVTFLQLPKGTLVAKSVACKEEERELSDKAKSVIVVCGVFILLMVAATMFDFYIVLFLDETRPKKPRVQGIANDLYASTDLDRTGKADISSNALSSFNNEKTPLLSTGSVGSSVTNTNALSSYSFLGTENGRPLDASRSATQTNALSHHAVDVKKVAKDDPKSPTEVEVIKYKPGKLGQLLLSFSMYTNGSKILDTRQAAGTLTAVNGLRFLSMSWVILGHTLSFKGQAPENYNTWIAKVIKTWPFQAIANATVSVDSFFVLSGLLVAYLSLKEMERKGGPKKFNWFLYYFHRFWRLTPPYMLVMMVYIPLLGYWGDGPIWNPNGIEKDECRDTWWYNILYINNLIDHTGNPQCMGWSWYLANDMQFYVISPLMLIPLYYSKIAGGIVCFALILTNLICSGVISGYYEFYSVQKVDSPKTPGYNRSDMLYVKPYTRIGPYVIGILVGYILYKTKCKVNMSKLWNLIGWTMAIALGCLIVYGPYTSDGLYHMTNDEAAFFNAAHRIGWGIAVGWVIFACATGYGGPVNTLLSWRGIIPLSRLTYCAYLVHPVVMKTYYNSVRSLQHWYDLEFVYQFLANLTWSMATAFIVSLAFEAPMMGIEKVLLAKYKK